MGSLWLKNKSNIPSVLLFLFILFPSLLWGAGYQEEKLFDGAVYSHEELMKKIDLHNREIEVLEKQINSLEKDIDWTVLKVNQIQDSGRTAPVSLKETITQKEKKIHTLSKTKNRLDYLVKYYSEMLGADRQKTIEDIYRKKIPELKKEKAQKQTQIDQKEVIPPKKVPVANVMSIPFESDPDKYDGISKTELQKAINKAGLSDWVEIVGTGTCLRIETTLPILFPTGSAKIATEYKTFFKTLADFLKPYDVKILVNGYADVVPINNKKYPSNFELGATRAANIVHQMVSHGLKPSIFKVESTGKHRFAAKGMSKQKSLERRAEVTVIFSG